MACLPRKNRNIIILRNNSLCTNFKLVNKMSSPSIVSFALNRCGDKHTVKKRICIQATYTIQLLRCYLFFDQLSILISLCHFFEHLGLDKDALALTPSDKHIARLAALLNINDCKVIAINLGLTENNWIDIEYEYDRKPLIVKIMALLEWRKNNHNSTLGDFSDKLCIVERECHLLCKVCTLALVYGSLFS